MVLSKRELAKKHIDKKLRNRLRIFLAISLVLLGIVVYDVFSGVVSIPLAIIGIIIGILLGIFTARMFHLSWDHDAKQIVSRLDLFGGMIIVLYVLFALVRGQIIGYFVHGSAVGGVSLAIVTGIMIGRFIGTNGKIFQLLKENNVF